MLYIEDYSDERLKGGGIHCGAIIASVRANRDHVSDEVTFVQESSQSWRRL